MIPVPASRGVAVAAVTVAALAVGCGDPGPVERAGAPVVWISIDTTRADRLPAYGHDGISTPAIDRIARDGVRFDRAYAPVPLTLPSHATMFTGLLPPEHGVRDNRGFRLDDGPRTLATVLADAGYATAGFVSSAVLRGSTGIGRGFEVWDDAIGGGDDGAAFAQRRGNVTVDRATAWLDGRDPRASFFLFVHLFDPHSPYDAPEPYASRAPTPYEAEIEHVDAHVAALLDALDRAGVYDDALIVLSSDHGEGLGDHGEMEHGILLYRETLHVPLLVKLPGGARAGERIDQPAALADVAATVLDVVGVEGAGVPGPAWFRAAPDPDRTVYAETWFPRLQYGWSDLRAGIRGPWHYIEGPDPELYDVVRDPAETENRLAVRGAPEAIVQALETIGTGRSAEVEIDDEERRQLASLGYVGGGGAEDTGIDPKRVVRDAERLWAFVEDGPQADPGDASVLRSARAIGPGNAYLHGQVARTLLARGRIPAALEVLRPFDASDDPALQVLIGKAILSSGRPGDADARFDRVLAVAGDHAEALLGKGLVRLDTGPRPEAEDWIRRALDADPGLAEGWNALAVARLGAGRPDEAIDALERAVERDPGLADAWYNLAVLRGRGGDVEGAATALRRYVPLVDGGARDEAVALLRRIEEGG